MSRKECSRQRKWPMQRPWGSYVLGIKKQSSVCLESNEPGKELGRWGGEAGRAESTRAHWSGCLAPTQKVMGAFGQF